MLLSRLGSGALVKEDKDRLPSSAICLYRERSDAFRRVQDVFTSVGTCQPASQYIPARPTVCWALHFPLAELGIWGLRFFKIKVKD